MSDAGRAATAGDGSSDVLGGGPGQSQSSSRVPSHRPLAYLFAAAGLCPRPFACDVRNHLQLYTCDVATGGEWEEVSDDVGGRKTDASPAAQAWHRNIAAAGARKNVVANAYVFAAHLQDSQRLPVSVPPVLNGKQDLWGTVRAKLNGRRRWV